MTQLPLEELPLTLEERKQMDAIDLLYPICKTDMRALALFYNKDSCITHLNEFFSTHRENFASATSALKIKIPATYPPYMPYFRLGVPYIKSSLRESSNHSQVDEYGLHPSRKHATQRRQRDRLYHARKLRKNMLRHWDNLWTAHYALIKTDSLNNLNVVRSAADCVEYLNEDWVRGTKQRANLGLVRQGCVYNLQMSYFRSVKCSEARAKRRRLMVKYPITLCPVDCPGQWDWHTHDDQVVQRPRSIAQNVPPQIG